MRDNLVVFGSLALVAALAVVWAVFFRSRRHRHHSHRRADFPATPKPIPSAVPKHRHHRWRRLQREHRRRNPTLAETGGLPPIRSEPPPDTAL